MTVITDATRSGSSQPGASVRGPIDRSDAVQAVYKEAR